MIGSTLKAGMALGLAASLMTAAVPARAGGGGAIAAGIIGGTALGVLAGAAIANSPPPPPPGIIMRLIRRRPAITIRLPPVPVTMTASGPGSWCALRQMAEPAGSGWQPGLPALFPELSDGRSP